MAVDRAEVEFVILTCERCGYRWHPRNPEKPPIACPEPSCRSRYWATPRRKLRHAS